MLDDTTLHSSGNGNATPNSSTPMVNTNPSSLNSLLMGSLLRAYSGSLWTGINTKDWLKLLEELFLSDNINTDASKINVAWRYIHTSEGSARSILTNNIDIQNVTTWKTFSATIL